MNVADIVLVKIGEGQRLQVIERGIPQVPVYRHLDLAAHLHAAVVKILGIAGEQQRGSVYLGCGDVQLARVLGQVNRHEVQLLDHRVERYSVGLQGGLQYAFYSNRLYIKPLSSSTAISPPVISAYTSPSARAVSVLLAASTGTLARLSAPSSSEAARNSGLTAFFFVFSTSVPSAPTKEASSTVFTLMSSAASPEQPYTAASRL